MKKSLLAMAAVLLSVAYAGGTAQAAECYSSGTRVGVVQKFSEKGLFNKSYEGQLVQDGIRTKGDAGGATNIWRFSVLDPAIARKIDDASLNGQPVALRYCQALFHNHLSTSTPYVVTDVVAR